jgi:two-component system KDP operon response regulator KdpE
VASRILVVDDDPQIRRVLRATLGAARYDVDTVSCGEEALATIHKREYHLILLDLGLPGMDGLELCRALRATSDAEIIIISIRNTEKDIVAGLDAGAGDYVTKPFRMPELLARMRSALRRNVGAAEAGLQKLTLGRTAGFPPAPSRQEATVTAGVEIDFAGRRVTAEGKDIRLTPKECDVLRYLANHPDKPIPHREILSAVWGPEHSERPEYLRAFIKQLRKKIEPEPARPRFLLTEPWVGYRLHVG